MTSSVLTHNRTANVEIRIEEPDELEFECRWPVAWPVLAMIAVSLVIRWADLDLRISGLFFDHVSRTWPYEVTQPWRLIYQYGMIPSLIVGLGGGIVAFYGKSVLPRFGLKSSKSQRAGLFLVILLAVGPGLLINGGFKELWGRPRPLQCTQFYGDKPFLPVGTWGDKHLSNSSFPSGHAAVAFYLMAPGFIAGPRRPGLKWTSFLFGILYGLGMGLIRVAQGGHFVSDVLWAGAIVYLTGVALAWSILRDKRLSQRMNNQP